LATKTGLRGLSGSWVDERNINAKKGEALSGAFLLRAIDALGLVGAAQT